MTEALLQFRVYALYYKNKKVLAFIIVGYIATTVTSAWILGSGMSIGQSFPTEIPGGSTCTFPAFGKNLYQAWIPFSVYDTVLCALVVYRGYATYRSERLFGGKGRSLVNVMVRDSVVAFVFLTISYITSILLWNVLPPVYVQIPAVVIAGLSGIFSSRMILNIRDQATKQNSAFTSGNNWYLSETTFYG
ncbi:hypothetical protein CPC08DRAFT_715073 [Agrocybe pediades]|nr:hypothetical protein CPC08DRAFT_715073 [Agrocybe pediades]